jgi:uncharacterized protein (DUF488 family)
MIELMTIGYEALTPLEFFGILDRCRVSMLVDIRELPISRKPKFAKAALSASAEARNIQYEHVSVLGCPRDIRHDYRADQNWERYTRRFNAYIETQKEALEVLASWMKKERCCLLCYEEDFNFCHRSIVAEKVVTTLEDDVKINHLTGPIGGRVVWKRLATV